MAEPSLKERKRARAERAARRDAKQKKRIDQGKGADLAAVKKYKPASVKPAPVGTKPKPKLKK